MIDRLLPDLPYPAPVVIPPSFPLPDNPDESLFLHASARWRESNQGIRELFAATPGVRDTLDQLLKQKLDLDGQQAGLLFFATDEHPERFVSFTDACAFVLQHPTLETTLDQRCRVTGLNPPHSLSALTPLQMLERLKTLNPEQAHSDRWRAFWDQRAPGTPVSRRERAVQLYRDHIEAAAQVAFARRTVTAEQLKPLLLIIDPPLEALSLNNQPIHTEELALVLSNDRKVKLPGAWVISAGNPASVSQLLYLPCRPTAIQAFNQRSDMQDWLSRQTLVSMGLPIDNIRFEYTARTDPLVTGISDLFSARQQAQITALRNGTRDKPGLAEHGAQSLVQANQIDRQRSNGVVFASPPMLEKRISTADGDTEADEQPLFGSLYADIPWPQRQAALNTQRDALETWLEDDSQTDRQRNFKDSLKALETAEQAADTAASALLYRTRTLDLTTFNREFSALYQAHKDGLQAEARLQLAQNQLDSDEFNLLKAVLDTPAAADRDAAIVAASLSLSMTEQNGATITVQTEALNGPFVITRPATLLDPSSSHSLLLYWPGSGGGLQRFASRRELERQVFKIQDQDKILALQLKKIDTDPLHYSLNEQTTDYEEKAGLIRQRAQHADELETLRKQTLAALQVPVHAARSLVFSHLLEQDRSATLASSLPDWLSTLPADDRVGLKALIETFIPSMRRSHEFLAIALEPRDDFTRKHLHARLRKDFSIEGSFEVKLDLPDSVKLEKRADPAPGYSGTRLVPVPSVTRSKMSLEELAQLNIDNTPSMQLEPLSLRLGFMKVEVSTADETERQRLTAGITVPYLKKLLPELDLPKAYEKLIRDTFMGAVDEPVFVKDHRRECLIEPWRVMLKLQGEFARLQRQISHDDLQVLDIAIDANTPEAWRADRKRIVILPAYLSAGGSDTSNQGPATLSGVTFIQEQISGMTLLYLPDSPDNQFLRRYDNLEAARKALFNLCVQDKWVSYLAGRALEGSVRAHESRINQAVLQHFDAMIGVGVRWPATTSLAAHLLDAHMGRLIEAHRGTSRSNDALYMERYALKGPRAFNYLKMALGLLPFVGTAFALYDAWTAANQAVAAFLRGDVGDGLAEIESVLLSLIDAAMDLLPGEAAFSVMSKGARSLTRVRQLRALARSVSALQAPSMRQARHVVARFAGYEYEQPISLSGLQPATHGIYRNIYRHADGDFIVRQGRIFQVERSNDSRNWRLRGTRQVTYKQPIALDEAGHWDTWFGVHGTTFEGGGLGGGQVFGHLADALNPIWPQTFRQRLPRWWADQAFRRHHQLAEAADDLARQLETRGVKSDSVINQYGAATAENRPALMPAAEAACVGDIELAARRYQTLVDLQPLTRGNKQRALIEMQSKTAWLLTDRYRRRALHASHSIAPLTKRIDDLTQELDNLPSNTLTQRVSILEEIRTLRVEYVRKLDQMEALKGDVNLWYERIRMRSDKEQMTALVDELNTKHSEANLLYLRTSQRLEIIKRYGRTSDVSWYYLLGQAQDLRAKVDRALYTQYKLPEVSATRAQRNQVLQDCLTLYTQFRREMKIWTTSYPQHFHLDEVEPLMTGIEKIAERARKGIIEQPAPTAPAGQVRQRVFTTEDDQLLIGVERWEPTTQRHQYVSTGRGGYEEIWEQASNGKFRLLNPPDTQPAPAPAQMNLPALVADARMRLDAQPTYHARVQSYAEQDMLPVDLEHMMVSEADELTRRADRIQNMAAQDPIIQQLRDKAGALKTTGRAMRTRQSLTSRKPTDGMLQDLIDQNAVEIRRTKPIKNLGKRKDGRTDYMQEYEIWDLTLTPEELLWYAHFHYSSAKPAVRQFEKAHLKLPEHRFLTHADDTTLPYADIGKRSAVIAHFENL
ncbi:dermonecrotic toxin domain-containing protein [Pseudomonas sp. EL_65y_Pfl2_R96]|uniref:dermonecrotic toxin domain-containing protein n=1 Tax=Pseudomonas sp. EL_65y_Pfl2_R96 TaxID=3088699 RepID=UPI0030DDB058